MYLLCLHAKQENKWDYAVIAVLIYAIIFGMRYGVGVDFDGYLDAYNNLLLKKDTRDFEVGFYTLMKIIASLNLHSSFFFGVISFLQLYLIFKSIKPDKYIYTYLVYTFMIGCIWLSYANGLRQVLAFCFFVYSLSYVEKRKPVSHYLCILLAISMHTSAILLIVFYPLLSYKKEWFKDTKTQLLLLAIAVFIGHMNLFNNITDYLQFNSIFEGKYSIYSTEEYSHLSNRNVKKGLGYILILIADIIIIAYSSQYKQALNNTRLTYMYNFYYIGALMRYIFISSSMIMGRINYYFYGFNYIVAAYTLYYLYSQKKMWFFYLLSSTYFLTFVANMNSMDDNTAVYRFFWENTNIFNLYKP